MSGIRSAAALALLLALASRGAVAQEYTIEGPRAGSGVPVPLAVPQAGGGLVGPPSVSVTLPAVSPTVSLPTVGVAGSSIQPGFTTPTASVPTPQAFRPH